MKKEFIDLFCCPKCFGDLQISAEVEDSIGIMSGKMFCINSTCTEGPWIIRNYVPRFVNYGKYANSFGEQWKTFAKTQLDSDSNNESSLRWNSEVNLSQNEICDKIVIEFGSGAGRFVDVVSKRKAKLVIGIDITDAVDASQENLGTRNNVMFIQADFFNLPLKNNICDIVYSIGVLHHTPEPQRAFEQMLTKLKSNGIAALSLYEISLYKRPNRNSLKVSAIELLWALNMFRCELWRTVTTRVPDSIFLAYCKYFVPILHYLNKIPVLGLVRYLFPSTCYKNLPVEWSMLDTNDTYATKIVHQYRHKDIFQWFIKAGLDNIIVHNGRAGWVSLSGNKSNKDYAKYIYEQPNAPGI